MRSTALTVAVLVPLAAAQEPWRRPEPIALDAGTVTPVQTAGAAGDGLIAAFDVAVAGGTERLPLFAPVSELEAGRLPDGSVVVLAGGVREALDVYRFDPASRGFERYGTDGGRRLRSTFGDGLGSWPLWGGDGLLVFAFEREDAVQFRAGVGGRKLASRSLPLECDGFDAVLDPVSSQVEVAFRGADGEVLDRVAFAHPTAPRLDVRGADGGRVDFGDVPVGERGVRRIALHNRGGRRLDATLTVGPGFALRGAEPNAVEVRIEPGAAVVQELRFVPARDGLHVARLRVDAAAPDGRTVLELRGVGVAPEREPEPAPEPGPAAAVSGAADAADGSAAPGAGTGRTAESAEPTAVLHSPGAVALEARWRATERLVVALELAVVDRAVDRLGVRIGRRPESEQVLPVYGPGRVQFEVRARALDPIEIAAVGPGGPTAWVEIGAAPPALRIDGPWVVAHVPAASAFLLLEVDGPVDAPRRVLRAWRGRADHRGEARFDAASFAGDGAQPVRLQLMIPASGGDTLSGVLELGSSGRASRSDR